MSLLQSARTLLAVLRSGGNPSLPPALQETSGLVPGETWPDAPALSVVHYGNSVDGNGGIASVIRRHLARNSPLLSVVSVPTYDQEGSWFTRNVPLLTAFADLLRRPRGTLVHVHISHRGSLLREGALLVAARVMRHGVILTLHGSSLSAASPLTTCITVWLSRRAHVVHGFGDAYRARFRVPADRWRTIPNDIEIPSHLTERKQNIVLFAGDVGVRKGVDVLLDAWTCLPPNGWRLLLIGHTTAPAPMLASLQPSVSYLGPLPHGEVLAWMERARMVVQPSRAEAFPMTVCEALAYGCSVIGTNVGGMGDLLLQSGQLVVSVGDVSALARALGDSIRDEAVLEDRASAGQRYARTHLASTVVTPQWLNVYRTVAGNG